MLRSYLIAALLLTLGYVIVRLADRIRIRAALKLRFAQSVLVLALLAPVAVEWLPVSALPQASVQVWSGKPRSGSSEASRVVTLSAVSTPRSESIELTDLGLRTAGGCWIALLAAALFFYARRLSRLVRALRETIEVRRIGHVSIRIAEPGCATRGDSPNDASAASVSSVSRIGVEGALGAGSCVSSPYSAWLPGRAFVVLPLELVGRRADFAISVKHELQHHRQRDTIWVHILELVKTLYFWCPAVYGWSRVIEGLQELACDESLIGRRAVSPHAYASCLVRAAQRAVGARRPWLAGAAGMASGRSGRLLKRRVEMLLTNEAKQGVRSKVGGAAFAAAGGVIAVALLGGTALAARGLVRDRTITMAEAQRLAAATPAGGIQVDLNERVLAQLNRHLGTPDGRARLKAGLSRMPLYRAMIERKLGAAGLPLDLLAVPMAEAFYRNDVMSPEPYRARGIWQFIEPTAIRYGLRVDRFVDQRLDPELETDAAIAYYRDLMAGADFRGDWRLALMSYNVGESKVGSLIQRHRTRDPWRLHELDGSLDNYLPNVMALILILRHSQLVE